MKRTRSSREPATPRPDSSVAIGRAAERRVAEYLRERGCIVLGMNVRVGRDELDVVALDGRTLVVVEVRTRGSTSHGHAFETVKRAKVARLRRAAEHYMVEHDADEVRIDVAAVSADGIEIVENAIDFTLT